MSIICAPPIIVRIRLAWPGQSTRVICNCSVADVSVSTPMGTADAAAADGDDDDDDDDGGGDDDDDDDDAA